MIEDLAFNAFLKEKLEEDIVVPAVSAGWRWRRPLLMAASLAVVCGVFLWQIAGDDEGASFRGRSTELAMAILERGDESAASGSLAERLVAWQDVPFVELAD